MIPNYEDDGPPLTDLQIAAFLEWFDFEAVHKAMVALNWCWADPHVAGDNIPCIDQIKRTASYLLGRLGPECNSISTGGLEVVRRNHTVTLNFVVASWEEYETEDDHTNAQAQQSLTQPQSAKVQWRRLERGELLQCGDMWASHNPNTPERQAELEYNLQMQAVHNDYYNTPAYHQQYDEGSLWRPVRVIAPDNQLVETTLVQQSRKLTIP